MIDPDGNTGETDVAKMLAELEVEVLPGIFTLVSTDQDIPQQEIWAMISEREGKSLVLEVSTAHRFGLPVEFEASWLTLQVHSALEAVGLTAAVSAALGDAGIPCNVLAGFFHDHILVPADMTSQAVDVLERLRNRH